jgi:hypothetical protein
MPRPTYVTPLDVYRRFDPQVTQSQLTNNEQIGSPDDEERLRAAIEEFAAEFERRARPFREVRVGAGRNYVYKSATGKGFPIHVYLDQLDVVPFDASAGDTIERRTGIDTWTDITNEEGSSWVADYRKGKLTLFEIPGRGHLPVLRRFRDRFIRLSYRHGAPGGSARKGGQTTLGEALSADATPSDLSVADVSRLPPSGGTMLIDGTEYVRIDGVDEDADTVSVGTRGLRGTDGSTGRASGDALHYCPMDVRQAIADRTARELVLYEDWTDQLVDASGNATPPAERKLQEWQETFDRTVARYSDNYGYR